MITPRTILSNVMAACRSQEVADAAGVALAIWADTAYPRVFFGERGFIGHRNRGRLPFLEVFFGQAIHDRSNSDGGGITTPVLLRLHFSGQDEIEMQALSAEVLTACFLSIRSDDIGDQGRSETMSPIAPSPLGHMRDAELMVTTTFSRDDYERS